VVCTYDTLTSYRGADPAAAGGSVLEVTVMRSVSICKHLRLMDQLYEYASHGKAHPMLQCLALALEHDVLLDEVGVQSLSR